jgi:hypothetical protein
MSSNKNIYEVFDEFKKAKTKEERLSILRNNDSWALKNVIMGALHPDVKFVIKKIPNFKAEIAPAGLAYNHMTDALSKVYLFMENNPKVSPNLTLERKEQLLIQILESLEKHEAEVFANMIKKDLKVPHLTAKLANEAFPGLLPE